MISRLPDSGMVIRVDVLFIFNPNIVHVLFMFNPNIEIWQDFRSRETYISCEKQSCKGVLASQTKWITFRSCSDTICGIPRCRYIVC